jgi:hypothetical protein
MIGGGRNGDHVACRAARRIAIKKTDELSFVGP